MAAGAAIPALFARPVARSSRDALQAMEQINAIIDKVKIAALIISILSQIGTGELDMVGETAPCPAAMDNRPSTIWLARRGLRRSRETQSA
jgi:hypothetical protein